MPLEAKLQSNADVALATLVDALRARQAEARSTAGRFRQCICEASWREWEDCKPDPAALQRSQVDEYLAPNPAPGGPDLPGWTVTADVTDSGGVIWRRTVHVTGPETWRETGWAQRGEP